MSDATGGFPRPEGPAAPGESLRPKRPAAPGEFLRREGPAAPGEFLRREGPAALEWAASYLERVGELPVLAQLAPGDIRRALPARAPEQGEPFSVVLRDLEDVLLPGVTHWEHPRYFAYFPAATSEPAVLAEMLAATLNSVALLWRTAPASTELEAVVLSWVADLLGLPSGWHGHIEDTASTATFAAVIAAREASGRSVIVCSEQTHSSAAKAARMLGMELRKVPCDSSFRMRPDCLGSLDDVAIIIATVGTTAVAAVDPVPEVAAAARAAGAWLHVDAAYAGAAMVCPEFRWAFDGVGLADSVVVNAHKWMLTPMDCSLLWCSRPEDLRAAFSLVPEYLRTPDSEEALSLSEYGPALGRRFRSLKLWAVLRCLGRQGLQEHIRRGVELAALFESWLVADPDWEVMAPRHFSLVVFRLRATDEVNRRLLSLCNESGEAFLSHTVVDGRYALRLAVGGPLTREEDMRITWDVLKRIGTDLRRS
ncbi:MAG TPA: aminotransferase class V-fold PLP-dependent enzyme [Solirubrobacteraceae bacterium]|nr:aminotransferase class V-fold PLP-dependent enzyme [Solirubrobacteraceae bacterium]